MYTHGQSAWQAVQLDTISNSSNSTKDTDINASSSAIRVCIRVRPDETPGDTHTAAAMACTLQLDSDTQVHVLKIPLYNIDVH